MVRIISAIERHNVFLFISENSQRAILIKTNIMIPKIIHYCWLSDDPIPTDLQNYMASWRKKLPEYEFIHWNFERFDKASSKWVSDAFDNKKYAFAADYIRLYALYNYGGIYLDMDVEVLKSFNPFLNLHTMLGWQNDIGLEVAAFGVKKHSDWVGKCLDYYNNRNFVKNDGTFDMKPLPLVIGEILEKNSYKLRNVHTIEEAAETADKEIPVFPSDYFSPKSYKTGKIQSNDNTYSIHHFAGSWIPCSEKVKMFIKQKISGKKINSFINGIRNKKKNI